MTTSKKPRYLFVTAGRCRHRDWTGVIRKGATVTRVTGSEMRAGLDVWLINRRAEKARQEA